MGSGASAMPMATSVVTDTDGAFELRGVAPGRTSVAVAAYKHHSKIVPALDVATGAVVGPLRIELSPTAEGEQPRIETAGIGVSVAATDEGVVIARVMPEGGAADAGLSPGDTIVEVDGVAVADLGFNGSLQRIRGPEGTTVQLTVRRNDGESFGVEVVRKKIRA
jgi:S1-C subfamily serine protease